MDIRNRKEGSDLANQKSPGRRAYSAIVAGIALSLMLNGTARAQDNQNPPPQDQQQNQDQGQPDQQQPPSQDQPPAPSAASTKPRPKYASQDANRPPYANDREQQGNSPYGAPPPSAQQDPGDQGDQDQPPYDQGNNPQQPPYDPRDQQGPDTRQAAPPPYRGRATRPPQGNYNYSAQPAQPTGPLPASLQIPAGTVLSVRMNDFVSSDKNSVGDRITATLDRPIVVSGWVVARRGQTISGQVTAAVKAGRIKGTSQLGLELTDLQLVDGNSAPILTEIWKGSGGTTHGADAAAIGGTTALGAAIGAAADWGRGAAIGAGAGAAAGIGAVLLTRGRPTVIPPDTWLTFRLKDPVTVDTTQSAQAFLPVSQYDYDNYGGRRGSRYAGEGPYASAPYACGYDAPCYPPPAYAYPYGVYPGYYYPYPAFSFGYYRGWRRW